MKKRVALGLLALLVAYAGYEWVRIRRTLAAAALPEIPIGARLRFGDPAVPDPYTVVVLGDSTAHGIGADRPEQSFGALVARGLARRRGAALLVNLGVSGARADDVLTRQLPGVAALDPDLVLLSVGANDVTGWTDTDDYLSRMSRILEALERTGATVAVLNVPAIVTAPLLPPPARLLFDVRTHRYNDRLRPLVLGRERAVYVPIYEESREPFERDRTNFAADEYHPSPKCYALWARIILRALEADEREVDQQ